MLPPFTFLSHFILKSHVMVSKWNFWTTNLLFSITYATATRTQTKFFAGLKQMLTFWKGCHWLYRSLRNRHFLSLLKSVGQIAITTGLYSVQQCYFLCRKYLSADETILDQGINHIQWNFKYSASRKNCFWQCGASQKCLLLSMQETQQ